MKINVIGSGTWGISFASYLSKIKHQVYVYYRKSSKSTYLIENYEHPNLKGYKIPKDINFISNYDNLDSKNLYILAVPTNSLFDCMNSIENKNSNFLLLCKGFDYKTGMLPSELLEKKLKINKNNIAVLSGPNHAEEIISLKPTASIISSVNDDLSNQLQQMFSSNTFRLYRSQDIIGVQIGAAIKNVIAIASGLCVGLNLGDNIQASLVSRGMNEIVQLAKVYNLKINTLYGLSGLGDLVGTCYSNHSRNRKLGILLAEGKTLNEAKNIIGMVSEGVNTTTILNDIIMANKLEMPICTEIYNILFDNSNPEDSLMKLMTRTLKAEG